MPPEVEAAYEAQLGEMLLNARKWRALHTGQVPEINFVAPSGAFIIGIISDALKAGYVKTNEAGLDLLKALWDWNLPTEPTVAMCQAVLEALYKEP